MISYASIHFRKDIDFLDDMESPPRGSRNSYRQLQLPVKLLRTNSRSSLLLVTRQVNARTIKRTSLRAPLSCGGSCKSRAGSPGARRHARRNVISDESINSPSIRRVKTIVLSSAEMPGFRNLEVARTVERKKNRDSCRRAQIAVVDADPCI